MKTDEPRHGLGLRAEGGMSLVPIAVIVIGIIVQDWGKSGGQSQQGDEGLMSYAIGCADANQREPMGDRWNVRRLGHQDDVRRTDLDPARGGGPGEHDIENGADKDRVLRDWALPLPAKRGGLTNIVRCNDDSSVEASSEDQLDLAQNDALNAFDFPGVDCRLPFFPEMIEIDSHRVAQRA
jgi:hypothetical protein